MADFFFFTDVDLLEEQPENKAFGPLTSSITPDEYRITSVHTASDDPMVYAVCDGIVCIQPVASSSTLVNLILKPVTRPKFEFASIDYFVYKGIKLASLLDGSFIQISGNDLVDSINSAQTALNTSIDKSNNVAVGTTTDRAEANALGFDLDDLVFPDSDRIDKLFFRDDDLIQFPIVKGGDSLGKFDKTAFGFEIIASGRGHYPKLEIVRKLEHSIVVPELTGSPTAADEFRHWNLKEDVLNFIDPAAFFGSFFTSKLKAKTSSGSFEKKSKNEIYSDVLISFFNKDKVYVDIRNEHNFSFNYYGNYGVDLGLRMNDSTISTINYYQSGWPVLILNSSDFPTGNTEKKNLLCLTLPKGDNEAGLLFINTGIVNRGRVNGRLPKSTKRKRRFVDLISNDDLVFQEIEMALPNNDDIGDTALVSSYVKLTLVKKLIDPDSVPASSGTVLRSKYPLDHVFTLQTDSIPFTGSASIKNKVFADDVYIDTSSFNGLFYFAKTGIAIDDSNVTFYSFASIKQKVDGQLSLTSELSNEADHFINYLDNKLQASEVKSREATFSAGSPIQLLVNESDSSSFLSKFRKTPADDVNAIVIGASDFITIQSLAASSFDPEFKVFFALANKNEPTELDDDDLPFTRFDLVLHGFVEVSGSIEIQEVNTTLKIYSHDLV